MRHLQSSSFRITCNSVDIACNPVGAQALATAHRRQLMTTLIIGAHGQIGQLLVEQLVEQGEKVGDEKAPIGLHQDWARAGPT